MDVAANLAAVQQRIAVACAQVDRDPADVRLMAVSKTHPPTLVRAAYDAGARLFGENRVQELTDKAEALAGTPDLSWAAIGHLQTNKAKLAAQYASEFHALDSAKIAEALDRRLQQESRALDVFVQVNSSGEEQKYGLDPDDVIAFITRIERHQTMRIRGLMTLAVFSADQEQVAACFATMVQLRDRIRQETEIGDELSMGMSGDFELAIQYGATTVRVGQAIFGSRLEADDYWG
ncbi:MAG: YggS family pyridoxal phosphate-dependent enzyme [Propionibacteriaceae bacterium]